MILTNFLAIGVLISFLSILFIFWSFIVEKTIRLGHETANINPINLFRSSRIVGMNIIKNFITSEKEPISATAIIELLFSLILLGIMVLLLPYKGQILIDYMGSLVFLKSANYSFFLKMILVLTLLNNFSTKNNLVEVDLYNLLSTQLNKLYVILFNFYVINEITPLNTLMIWTYPGVLISLLILIFMMTPQKQFIGKSIFIRNSKKVLTELTWSLFITFYFFNISKWIEDEVILTFSTLFILAFLIWVKRNLEPITAKVRNRSSESKLIKLAIKISLINFIIMEAYDFF
jgi:hypothetical protein